MRKPSTDIFQNVILKMLSDGSRHPYQVLQRNANEQLKQGAGVSLSGYTITLGVCDALTELSASGEILSDAGGYYLPGKQ